MADLDKDQEIQRLRQRVDKLSKEKSNQQMVGVFMTSLASVSGLDEITKQIIQLMGEMMGGENVVLFYHARDGWSSIDILGQKRHFDFPVDSLVGDVVRTGMSKEVGKELVPASHEENALSKLYETELEGHHGDECHKMSLAIPLKVGGEVIGVVKFENMSFSYDNLTPQLEIIANYLALVLKNELFSYNLLEQAYDELEKKNLELRRSEESLRTTLDSIGDGVIATDASGKIVRMNPAAEAMTEWKMEDACGRPLREIFKIVNANTREPEIASVMEIIEEGKFPGLSENALLIGRKGRERRVADSGAPIKNDNGETVGAVFVFRDVTEKYNLEEKIRHSQKMDSIGQLAGGVAHDFNNMLGGILGGAELLARKSGGDETLGKYINMIIASAQRAAELTRKLLDFSRKGKILSEPIDMHTIISETVALLSRSVDKRIKIQCELNAKNSIVNGDPSQLQNTILNLGVNARDAMPDGGDLIISTSNTKLDEDMCARYGVNSKPGYYIEILVQDTGCGMDRETQSRIFEPFFTTKEVGKGTGLGLASVYGTIKAHHGVISVYSEIDKGTVFKLYLPLEAETKIVTTESYDGPKATGSGCVLLVDDEWLIRETTLCMLEEVGYKVLIAEDGVEAIEVYKREKGNIDIVLLDMIMPRKAGRDTFYELQKINPEVKILISSGFSRDGDITKLLSDGALGFVAKPYCLDELAGKLEQALKG